MLNQVELSEFLDRLGIPSTGKRLIEKARQESPVREVQSRLGNVITNYVSKKMGKVIQAESRTVEYPAIIHYEHDKSIIEYFDQPCKLDLILTDGGTKKPYRVQHTPDFLLIQANQVTLEEWREEGRLIKLAQKYPGRWVKESDGWHFPEAEEQLADMGIVYRIRSANELPRQFILNLQFLSDYMNADYPPLNEQTIQKLRAPFVESLVMGLADFIDAVSQERLTSDDVYKGIADGLITFNLNAEDIGETSRARVFRDETAMAFLIKSEETSLSQEFSASVTNIEVGATVEYEGMTYQIALIGVKSVMLSSDDGTTELAIDVLEKQFRLGKLKISSASQTSNDEILPNSLSSKEIQQALVRREILEKAATSPDQSIVSTRTLQRYRKAINEAGETAFSQNLALIPNHRSKGNRQPKLPQEVLDSIAEVAKTHFNKASGISKRTAYKMFRAICTEKGIAHCSEKTFNTRVTGLTSIRAREGKRSEYQKSPITWYLNINEPIHGVRPFEFVHIDHTPLDIVIKLQDGKELSERIWLTLAIDAESRRIVGYFLTVDPPSYRSCMMVIRDIVRRHGRLPEMLVLDNGKEFKSKSMKRVCKLYGCSIRYRPAAKPRFGSVMERVFGTVNTEFIHNLEGNTKLMKHVRTVTKSVRPEKFAEWTLTALHGGLDYYFENIYGTEIHPAHGETPIEHFNRRMNETGMRRNRLVCYDRTFMIETCPSPDQTDTRVVDGQRGVKVNHIWYWCEAFRTPNAQGKPLEIRIDPWDVRYIYAFVNNSWYQCRSKLIGILRGYTTLELRYAFDELAKKHGIQKKDLSPERIAEWMRVLDAKNFDPRLKQQQEEARNLYGPLGMTSVGESETHQCEKKMIHSDDADNLGEMQLPENKKVISIRNAKNKLKQSVSKEIDKSPQQPNDLNDDEDLYGLM